MLEQKNILPSLSDYAIVLKQKAYESLYKQYNNNNLIEMPINTQSCNNDKLNSSFEIDIKKSNINENNSNKLLCSTQAISKIKFNTQNETKTLKIDNNKKEFNLTGSIRLLDCDSMNIFPKCGRIPNILKNIKKGKHDNKAKDNYLYLILILYFYFLYSFLFSLFLYLLFY